MPSFNSKMRAVVRPSIRHIGSTCLPSELSNHAFPLKTTTSSSNLYKKRSIHLVGCKRQPILKEQQRFGRHAEAMNSPVMRHFSQSTNGEQRSNYDSLTSHISQQLQACQNARDLSMLLRTNGRFFYGRQEFEGLHERMTVLNKTTRMTPAHAAGLMNALSTISTVAKSQQRQALLDLSVVAHPMLKNFQVKELCIILNSLARKDVRNDKLFYQSSQLLLSMNHKMNPQDLAIFANAFGRVQHPSPKLFEVIAIQAIPQIQDFTPQGLANLVNAFAKQDHLEPKLFEAVAKETERRLLLEQDDDDASFSPQGLANIANAFAKMNCSTSSTSKMFAAIADAAMPGIHGFTPQNLSNLASAFAKMNHQHCGQQQQAKLFFDVISEAALGKLSSFNAQELANLANAMVKIGHDNSSSTKLLQEIALAAMPLLSTFKAQELAMLMNALIKQTIGETQDDIWKSAAAATISLLPKFQPQELCIIANAFSKVPPSDGWNKADLFKKTAAAALNLLLLDEKNHQFPPHNLSILANAFAKVDLQAAEMFQALMERAIPLLPNMSPQEVANLVSAVAKLRLQGPMVNKLFAETSKLLVQSNDDRNLASWEQRNLVEVAYAFLKAFQTDDMVLERIGSEISSRPGLELDAVGLGHLAAVMSRTPIECSSELLRSIFARFMSIPIDTIQISNVADVCKALPLAYELGAVSRGDGNEEFLERMVEYSIRKRHDASPSDVRDLLLNLASPRLNNDDGDAGSSMLELQQSLLVAYQPILDQFSDQIATKHVKTIRRAYKRLHVAVA